LLLRGNKLPAVRTIVIALYNSYLSKEFLQMNLNFIHILGYRISRCFLILVITYSVIGLNAYTQIPGIPADNELYKKGFLDVTLLGADSTGQHISTSAIQNAVNLARDNDLVCYFPSGTYLVDDTIKCMKPAVWINNRWEEVRKYCVLMGDSEKRPLIKLVPGAAAYQNASYPIPVFWFWSMCFFAGKCSDDCMGNEDPNCNNASINYNQSFRNIDIDLGGNPGAVAIKHAAAQGASIEDVYINATGAFAGLYNPPGGVAGGVYNVEVTGGEYGVYYVWKEPYLGWNVNQSNFPVLVGCVFKNQETSAFHLDLAHPMVLVGFHIIQEGSGSINTLLNGNGISMIDGIIESGGGQLINGNTANIYMNNVHIRGASSIANNWEVSNPGSWTRINEYSYSTSSGRNILEGNITTSVIQNKTENLDIDSKVLMQELKSKHIWNSDDYRGFEKQGFVNVKDHVAMNGNPAKGDGSSSDSDALEYAIANYDKIFLPKGTYQITRDLTLGSNTMIIGTHRTYSSIRGANVQTINDANATSTLAFLNVRNGNLNWRAGRNSMVRSVSMGRIDISENGGGRWYAPFNVGSRTTVIGTTEPLAIYGFNPERAAEPQVEITDARNVRLYFVKTEAGVGGQGHSGSHNTPVRITNSENIALFSCLGNVTLSEDKALVEVINSNNVIVTHVRGFKSGAGWYEIKETIDGVTTGIRAGTTLATYKRGSLSPSVIDNYSGSFYELYPNPNSGYVTIDLLHFSTPYHYKIFDFKGNLMDSGILHKSSNQLELPTADGMYFIAIADQERMAYTKVSKL
jgi:hypothetical protein